MADPDGAGPLAAPVFAYQFDLAGQLLSETGPLGRETSYEYDDQGRVTKTTLPDPDGPGFLARPEQQFVYDDAGNLLSETDPLGHTTQYGYDEHDNRVSITTPDPDGVGGQAAAVTSFSLARVSALRSVAINNLDLT